MATEPVSLRSAAPGLLARLDACPLHIWGALRNDALNRAPAARAAMIAKSGIRRAAIDWRYAQLETLDVELTALRKAKVAVNAIWAPISLYPVNDGHLDLVLGFLERNGLQVPLWTTLMHPHDIDEWIESKKVDLTCEAVTRVADRAATIGCSVSLYNYDGWFARPTALRKILSAADRPNVGIVYNFHHAQQDVAQFEANIRPLLPWMGDINLGGVGLPDSGPIAFGEGQFEFDMLKSLLEAGYCGSIGLTCFDAKTDAFDMISRGLSGLKHFRRTLESAQG